MSPAGKGKAVPSAGSAMNPELPSIVATDLQEGDCVVVLTEAPSSSKKAAPDWSVGKVIGCALPSIALHCPLMHGMKACPGSLRVLPQ